MDTSAPSLIEFLLARIDEDEAVARAASDGLPEWEYAESLLSWRIQTAGTDRSGEHVGITFDREGLSDSVAAEAGTHIARHDPARVLAECEGKRKIVESAAARDGSGADTAQDEGAAFVLSHVLRFLALPYADHPDYQDAWRP
jgi:hypothetical protein